jgi:ABC-type branched-subunit amino acid transport system substrate-binding protein
MPRLRIRLAVGLSAVALLTAACGSTTSSSGTGPSASAASASATGSASAGSAATGSSTGPIVVGGLQDGNFAGIDTGFKARVARFNGQGGIDGRKIQFVGQLNDGDSLANDLSNTQTLVLKDHVFAVAPVADEVLNPASVQLLTQNTTPYLGWGLSPAFCGNNWGFPIAGCEATPSYQSTLALIQAAQAIGKPVKGLKVAVIGTDNSGGKAGTDGIIATNKIMGADVVYGQAPVPQNGTTDYAPYVQAIMAGNPDMVELVVAFQASVALSVALRQAGYKGALWNPGAYVPGLLASQPQLAQALTGSLVVADFPPSEQNSPAALQMESDLKAIGASPVFSLGEAIGWWSAEVLIQMLQATAAKGPLTQANFGKVINAGWTIKGMPGGISQLSFPRDHIKSTGCYGTLIAEGTHYVLKSPYVCNPADTISVNGG